MFIKEFRFFDSEAGAIRADIIKMDDGYQVIAELPGFTKSDVSLEYIDSKLIIKVIKKEENEKKEYILKERANNNLERSFYFGNTIDNENIKAKMENGLLEISLSYKKDLRKNIIID